VDNSSAVIVNKSPSLNFCSDGRAIRFIRFERGLPDRPSSSHEKLPSLN
jgi:hypothetical protein